MLFAKKERDTGRTNQGLIGNHKETVLTLVQGCGKGVRLEKQALIENFLAYH